MGQHCLMLFPVSETLPPPPKQIPGYATANSWELRFVFFYKIFLPEIFCTKSVSIGQRAEQISATYAYYILESGGEAPSCRAIFVIF